MLGQNELTMQQHELQESLQICIIWSLCDQTGLSTGLLQQLKSEFQFSTVQSRLRKFSC